MALIIDTNEPIEVVTSTPAPTKISYTTDKRTYMREYMRKRYNEDIVKARAYKNSLKYKKKYNLSAEDLTTYKEYLADVQKLRKIKAKLPTELFKKCLHEFEEEEAEPEAASE
jgi:ribosomal protein S4